MQQSDASLTQLASEYHSGLMWYAQMSTAGLCGQAVVLRHLKRRRRSFATRTGLTAAYCIVVHSKNAGQAIVPVHLKPSAPMGLLHRTPARTWKAAV